MAGNTVIFPPKQNAIDATQVKNIAKFKCIKLSANTATVVIESDKLLLLIYQTYLIKHLI